MTTSSDAEQDNLVITGIDDNEQPWREYAGGRSQEAWLLKQLYVERRYGRRNTPVAAARARQKRATARKRERARLDGIGAG